MIPPKITPFIDRFGKVTFVGESAPSSATATIKFLGNVADQDAIILENTEGRTLKFEFDSSTTAAGRVREIDNDGNHKGLVQVDVAGGYWTPQFAPDRLVTAINASSSYLQIKAVSGSDGVQLKQLFVGSGMYHRNAGNTQIQTLARATSGSLQGTTFDIPYGAFYGGVNSGSSGFATPLDALEHAKAEGLNPHVAGFIAAAMSGTLGPEYDGLRQGTSVRTTTHASAGTLIRINSGRPLPKNMSDRMDHSMEPNLFGNVKMFDDYKSFDDIVGRFDPEAYLNDSGQQQYPLVWYDLEVRELHLTDGVIEPLTIKGSLSVGTEIPFLAHGIKGDFLDGNIEPEDGSDRIFQYKEYTSGSYFLEPFQDAQDAGLTSPSRSARTTISFLKNVADQDAIVLTGANGKILKFEFDSGTNVIEIDNNGNHKGLVRVDVTSGYYTPTTAPARLVTAINASGSFLEIIATSGSNGVNLVQNRKGQKGNTPIVTLARTTSGSLTSDDDPTLRIDGTLVHIKTDGGGFFDGVNRWVQAVPGFTSDFVKGIVKFDDSYSMDPRGISVISGSIRDEGLIDHNKKSAGAGFTYGNAVLGTDSIAFGDLSRS